MTNVTGNSVPFANDLTGAFPKYINIRRGQFVCAIIAFAITPWNIEAKATTFLAFLGSYTLFLGGLSGVILSDYFILKRKFGINLTQLFRPYGLYWYNYGINWRAFVAFFVAIAPMLPGMVNAISPGSVSNQGILNLYALNYPIVVVVGAIVYVGLSLIFKVPQNTTDEDEGKAYLIEGIEPKSLEGGVVPMDDAGRGGLSLKPKLDREYPM